MIDAFPDTDGLLTLKALYLWFEMIQLSICLFSRYSNSSKPKWLVWEKFISTYPIQVDLYPPQVK